MPTATNTPAQIIEGTEGDFKYVIKNGEVSIIRFNADDDITKLMIPKEI